MEEEPKELKKLTEKVIELKKERDDLNTKLRKKRDELRGFYNEIDKLLDSAGKEKNRRDGANKKVSEYKVKRDEANKKIAELNKKLSELKKQVKGSVSRKDYEKLKNDYEKLNWKMQTSPLTKDKEIALVRKLEELEFEIKEYEARKPVESEIVKLEGKIKKVRQHADSSHKVLLQNSEEGEKYHEEMHKIYKKVDEKKEKAKKLETEFLEIKKTVDEVHNRYIEALKKSRGREGKERVRKRKSKDAEIERLKREQQIKEKEILADLKEGKVIKTEDLLLLQDTD